MRIIRKKLIPKKAKLFIKRIIAIISIISISYYDLKTYIKYSASIKGDYSNDETLLSAIMIDYHRIEKGLSLKDTKNRFGLWFIPNLIKNIESYHNKFGQHEVLNEAIKTVNQYINFHDKKKIDIEEIKDLYNKIKHIGNNTSINHIDKASNNVVISKFESFVKSRHSIRRFSPEIIERAIVQKAIEIAKHTPSVCNRQPWRVKFLTGNKCNQILEIQNGNLGFRNEVNNLIVVTGKLSFMRYTTERNQIYVDGGLFAMSLIYALHSLDIASVGLNWCVEPLTDKKAKQILLIDNDEVIILIMAIGKRAPHAKTTDSQRLETSSFLTVFPT